MVSACLTEQGDCLRHLGRLDEAASAYEKAIALGEQQGDDRGVAVRKGQLGTVYMFQRRYPEALKAHEEARERFTRLDEPGSVAVAWHQVGMVHQAAGQPDAAEDAYRQSLAIKIRLGDVAGQADTLLQLGVLYGAVLDRQEEAEAFFRKAADRYVEIGNLASEGRARNNLAITLRKLRRLDEAQQEIRRAIACKEAFGHASEPWKTWDILADIETDAGNPAEARQAKGKATACYLAYRRDGGENHDADGRLGLTVMQQLLAGDAAGAASVLRQRTADPGLPMWLRPFVEALQAIVAGSRDRGLADAPDLNYSMAAELLFLIKTLEKPR
jgi:tetratricopeptide (TPR) repeat protein